MLAAAQFVERPPSIVEEIVNRGYLGVDFFFVLSGFIILHAHLKDSSGAYAARKYLTKRLRRIYIPYLPVSIALIALYLMLPSVSQGSRDWSLLTSLTLIPTERPPALPVAWTLIHEMTFLFDIFFILFHQAFRCGGCRLDDLNCCSVGDWMEGKYSRFHLYIVAAKSRVHCWDGVRLRLFETISQDGACL